MDIKILSRLGMHEHSAIIYLDILRHGSAFLQEISNRTHLERMTIYRRIPELIEQGFIQKEVQGKRFLYRALSPDTLQKLLGNMEKEVGKTISELSELYESRLTGDAPIFRVNQGIRAIEDIYLECIEALPVGGTYYRYSSRATPNERKIDLSKYSALRNEKRIQRMVITNEALAGITAKKPGKEVVGFPGVFPFKQNFQKLIFLDRIAIIDLETLTVMVIESKMLASFEQAIFVCLFQYIERGRR